MTFVPAADGEQVDITSIIILNDHSHLNTILHHLNSVKPIDAASQFSQSYHLAALLLISTSPSVGGHGYDFFLVHALTTIQAVRHILANCLPGHYLELLRDWLLMTILVYVSQNRPVLNQEYVEDFNVQSRGWDFVREQALHGRHASDAHFVKACRALEVGAQVFGAGDEWFLKCAVRFASDFEAWGGFATEGEEAEQARRNRIRDVIHVTGWRDGWK